MDFHSTFYKKQANYDQIIKIQEKFEALDANGDKALNKNELANIFTSESMTEAEKEQFLQGFDKDLFIQGLDSDDDGFINIVEFSQVYTELDIDKNANITGDEFDFAKKKISELEKQTQINEQYAILNDLTATVAEKHAASNNIEKFKEQRSIIYLELDVSRKSILISGKDAEIQKIDNFIQNNDLLEFDEAKKIKAKEKLEVEKNLLLMEKEVSQSSLNVHSKNYEIIVKKQELETVTGQDVIAEIKKDLKVYAQEKISLENLHEKSQKVIEQHHLQVKIGEQEKLLKKFFVPEFLKEQAREQIAKLQNQQLLLTHRMDMYDKVSILSETRADLIQAIYNHEKNPTQQTQEAKEALQAVRDEDLLRAKISAKKVALIDKQMQLKALMGKGDRPQFVKLKADLEKSIKKFQRQLAILEAQLP